MECQDDTEAWEELGYRLVLEGDLVSPAGFAALPRLTPRSAAARDLAGRILERAAGHHDCDDLPADCTGAIAEYGAVLDRHLRSRPADYPVSFPALLAVEEEYHWANAMEGFTDDINHVECPHCGVGVTIVIGDFECYSQAWDGVEEIRRDLRPAAATELTGTGRWMHQITVCDGQEVLANGIADLFGRRNARAVPASSTSRTSTPPSTARSCGRPRRIRNDLGRITGGATAGSRRR
ncbi:hypothetical protein GCM10010405_53850 [Streptomyces macrosporus]|uniref:Uncharacterized protein n=1 Tax=Streptomyces macrosporus TaxID=44032 RepID=A0ABP5XVL1_9ACTN